jgi:hypothetical protein
MTYMPSTNSDSAPILYHAAGDLSHSTLMVGAEHGSFVATVVAKPITVSFADPSIPEIYGYPIVPSMTFLER